MRTIGAILLAIALHVALAQAPATPRAPDPSLIFDLLGIVNTIEVDLLDEVRHLFLVAMHEEEIALDTEREVRDAFH